MAHQSPRRVRFHWLRVGHCRHLEWVTLRGGSWRVVEFPALVGLILHPQEGPILYDTGYAEHFEHETTSFPARLYRWLTPVTLPAEERLEAQLARFGVAPGDVRRVLISHLHADHVAGLRNLPRARFVALREDVEQNLGRSGWGALRRAFLPGLLPADFGARLQLADAAPQRALGAAWAPFESGFDLLGDGSLLGVPLPGHAPAQLGLVFWEESGRAVMLAADACWSARAWRENRRPSALVRPLMHHWGQYRQTLARLHQLGTARPELALLPSHCRESFAAWPSLESRAGEG